DWAMASLSRGNGWWFLEHFSRAGMYMESARDFESQDLALNINVKLVHTVYILVLTITGLAILYRKKKVR
ncbi:MAG: hypothetical protein ACTSRA_21810, partial [Promethearchaeota archaeon]